MNFIKGKLIKTLENANTLFIRLAYRFFARHPKVINRGEVNKILIVAYMGIGNSVIFMPLIKNLIHFYKESEITILVNTGLLAEIIKKNFDTPKVIIAQPDKMNFKEKLKFFYHQRKESYDLVICNFLGIKKNIALLVLFSHIKYRVGHVFTGIKGKGKFDFIFNFPVLIDKKHELEFNLDLLTPLNIQPLFTEPIFRIGEQELAVAQNFLRDYKTFYKVVLQVYSSQGPHKSWPHYKALAKRISQSYNAVFILVGSEIENNFIEKVFIDSKVNYVNIAGRFSLFETVAIIEKCDLYIGNDSGLSHVSACIGQITISIFGMNDPQRARHIGKHTHLIRKGLPCSPCDTLSKQNYKTCPHKNCLVTIAPEDVMKVITEQNKSDELYNM